MLFIMLYKKVLTFESANEILKYDHSNESEHSDESYFSALSSGPVQVVEAKITWYNYKMERLSELH